MPYFRFDVDETKLAYKRQPLSSCQLWQLSDGLDLTGRQALKIPCLRAKRSNRYEGLESGALGSTGSFVELEIPNT